MNAIRRAHLVVGVLGLIAFVLSGLYMLLSHDGLRGMPNVPRLLYRTGHIYLLMATLLNLILGLYFQASAQRSHARMQALGSLGLMAGPFLLTASFLLESPPAQMDRPIAALAVYLALAGGVLHALPTVLTGFFGPKPH